MNTTTNLHQTTRHSNHSIQKPDYLLKMIGKEIFVMLGKKSFNGVVEEVLDSETLLVNHKGVKREVSIWDVRDKDLTEGY